ncbi:MAG: FxLYD domain-containing protein [Candidatus Geothermarchaeales archaeon]
MSRKKLILIIAVFTIIVALISTSIPRKPERKTELIPSEKVSPPEILSHTSYIDHLGYFTVVGEVKNNLQTNIARVAVTAIFYDDQGKVINLTEFGIEAEEYREHGVSSMSKYTDIGILRPGQKSPFKLSTYPNKIAPASYELTLTYEETGQEPFEGLVILSHTASVDEEGYHRIVGEVQNNGVRKAYYVRVVCTYHDSEGKVVGSSFAFTKPDRINVGEKAPFELSSHPHKIRPAYYELQVVAEYSL